MHENRSEQRSCSVAERLFLRRGIGILTFSIRPTLWQDEQDEQTGHYNPSRDSEPASTLISLLPPQTLCCFSRRDQSRTHCTSKITRSANAAVIRNPNTPPA